MLRKIRQKVLPQKIYDFLAHRAAQKEYYQYIKQKVGDRFLNNLAPGPVPPKKLIKQTNALNEKTLEQNSKYDVYFSRTYGGLLKWFELLNKYDFNLKTLDSVFELGCGTARIIKHFRYISGIKLTGSDINPKMIEWCKNNVPGPKFYVNELEPPLSFAEKDSFDLAIAQSVFTHIPFESQRLWFEEIARVVCDGGFFICNVLSENSALTKTMLGVEEQKILQENRYFTLTTKDSKASLSTKVGGSGWDVFITQNEVIKNAEEFFNILDYIPGYLDLLILKKSPAINIFT